MTLDPATYEGCGIPPEIHEIGFGWDPTPEVERLLFLSREAGIDPRSALELGCGGGRLLKPLRERGIDAFGIELSPAMTEAARTYSGADVRVGDMNDFTLDREFDLVYSSANSLRHIYEDVVIERMWGCVERALRPGGVFIADLELGAADEAARVGKPACWTIFRGDREIRVTWGAVEAPTAHQPITTIQWTFEERGVDHGKIWRERFPLRAYDAPEFVRLATRGGLRLVAIYEPREPHLIERPPDRAVGRSLVVLRRG